MSKKCGEFSVVVCETNDTMSDAKESVIFDHVGGQGVPVVLLIFMMSLY